MQRLHTVAPLIIALYYLSILSCLRFFNPLNPSPVRFGRPAHQPCYSVSPAYPTSCFVRDRTSCSCVVWCGAVWCGWQLLTFVLRLQAKAGLTARTDALCNITLLNASFQHCGLNTAEEAASSDLTRIEDSLETLRRRASIATTRVKPLMHPQGPVATPPTADDCSANARGGAQD